MGLAGTRTGKKKKGPSQRESGMECGTEGLWVLLREKRACRSGRQVTGLGRAGDLHALVLGSWARLLCLACFPFPAFP